MPGNSSTYGSDSVTVLTSGFATVSGKVVNSDKSFEAEVSSVLADICIAEDPPTLSKLIVSDSSLTSGGT